MMKQRYVLPTAILFIFFAGRAAGQQPVSYARQVRPFLAKFCLECHNADKMRGEFNLETYQSLRAGGKHGPVLTPGKPDDSLIVAAVEHTKKPHMPPTKSTQPAARESAVLRDWIASGAKDDGVGVKIAIPDIKPRSASSAAVAAVAYHTDNKLVVAGGYGEALVLELMRGEVVARIGGQTENVTALAFNAEGSLLAVASGTPGVRGELRIYSVPKSGIPTSKPLHLLPGHKDLIYTLAWSSDGKTLASAGYDRIIHLWDAAQGKELRVLKDHSDTIYGVAFSPDGKLLASAAADRAVKVWDVDTGRRFYTMAESTDWLYALAWSPDARHLAAAGVDQSIRVWEVSGTAGKLVNSAYAHEAPVLRLVYSADGKTLYSLGEDRGLKSWDALSLRERKIYPRQPEMPLTLAVRPDQKQLAIGRYDGALVLLDAASGKVQSQPLPVQPKPPQLDKLTPNAGRRGQALHLRCQGLHLDTVTDAILNQPGITAKVLAEGKSANAVAIELTSAADTPAGAYSLTLKNAAGQSKPVTFIVDPFDAVTEQEPNEAPGTAQKIALPVSIAGAIGKAGDVDYFRFSAKAGQQVGVQALTGAIGSKLEPVLQMLDASGRVLVESSSGVLGHTCASAGEYILAIRDRDYRGGTDMPYRLHVGDLPVVTAVFPLGLQRGSEGVVRIQGVNLGKIDSVPMKVPADAAVGASLPVPVRVGSVLGAPKVVVGEFSEVGMSSKRDLPVPGTANGVLSTPHATDTWRFSCKKGQRLIVEVHARRLGTPLDSFIEILDAQGKPVPRATLRCLAKTYTTFRDHDSGGTGIRIETWNDFAMNDYVLIGQELLRIRDLPKNPDDDCQFVGVIGQRVGQLSTTPTHHSMGTPMYKVAIHPPGSTFPPNGLPIVPLFYCNDDGGPGIGKDSHLFFDAPADGSYQVRIGDARGQAGPTYAYRLTVRAPRPGYTVRFDPTAPSVWKGNAVPITATATRIDGFDGAIDLRLENVPAGFAAPATSIPVGEESTAFALWAEPTAKSPTAGAPLKLVAHARIDGQDVQREAVGQLPKAIEPGDLVTTTGQAEVTVKPGGQAHLTVKVERRGGFTGRVPLDVRGLPHGVRVLDIGLNGILIIPGESVRTVAIYCEPWVKEMDHPFVVLSRREGKNSQHAAKSVLLRVRR